MKLINIIIGSLQKMAQFCFYPLEHNQLIFSSLIVYKQLPSHPLKQLEQQVHG